MNVVALLSFYDETEEFLTDLVASLAGRVDRLVAVDGAYAEYPWPSPYDPTDQRTGGTAGPHQAEVLRRVTAEHGIDLVLHTPKDAWQGNEIEKRNFLFQLGQEHSEPGDWFWIVDADEYVERIEDGWRDKLAESKHCVGFVTELIDGDPRERVPRSVAAQVRMFFRRWDNGPIRLLHHHADYRAPDCDLTKLWGGMNGGDARAEEIDAVVWHRALSRVQDRAQRRLDYYAIANLKGLDRYM